MSERPTGPPPAPPPPLGPPSAPSLPQFHLPVQRLDEDKGVAVWEEGVGVEEAVLEAAEQVRASQQLTDEQLGQLVRITRSRTKAARTHQLVQAQAQHATAAARRVSATRRASAMGRASAMRTATAIAIARG